MRGKEFHNYIVDQTGLILISLGWQIFLEFGVHKNGVNNFVDILATFFDFQMAFEIETTDRHLIDNCYKAYAAEVPLCVVVPTSKLYERAVKKIDNLDIQPAGRPIKVFKLAQLKQELRSYLSLIIRANTDVDR